MQVRADNNPLCFQQPLHLLVQRSVLCCERNRENMSFCNDRYNGTIQQLHIHVGLHWVGHRNATYTCHHENKHMMECLLNRQ